MFTATYNNYPSWSKFPQNKREFEHSFSDGTYPGWLSKKELNGKYYPTIELAVLFIYKLIKKYINRN